MSHLLTLGHQRIVAHHYIDNLPSGRVLEKVGFRRTGRVVERFSQGRGYASPSREHEVVFEAPADCDGNDAMSRRRAALSKNMRSAPCARMELPNSTRRSTMRTGMARCCRRAEA